MKSLIILFGLIMLSVISSAQSLSTDSIKVIKAKNTSYVVKRSGFIKLINVYNAKNKIIDSVPPFIAGDWYVSKSDLSQTKRAFYEVFNADRLRKLMAEKFIFIIYYVSGKNEILEIKFTLPRQNTMSVYEIERLENALKRNVSFTLSGTDIEKTTFNEVSHLVKYNMLDKW